MSLGFLLISNVSLFGVKFNVAPLTNVYFFHYFADDDGEGDSDGECGPERGLRVKLGVFNTSGAGGADTTSGRFSLLI